MSRSSPVPSDAAALSKPSLAAGRPESAVDMWLGQQLRQLRKQHGRSLADVAQACGMSLGLLSQIERGLSSASVKMLHQLAREFGVSVNALLRNAEHTEGEDGGRVARAGTHRYIDLREKGIVKEMYTPPACRSMDLCRATIEPGGSTGNELFVTGRASRSAWCSRARSNSGWATASCCSSKATVSAMPAARRGAGATPAPRRPRSSGPSRISIKPRGM